MHHPIVLLKHTYTIFHFQLLKHTYTRALLLNLSLSHTHTLSFLLTVSHSLILSNSLYRDLTAWNRGLECSCYRARAQILWRITAFWKFVLSFRLFTFINTSTSYGRCCLFYYWKTKRIWMWIVWYTYLLPCSNYWRIISRYCIFIHLSLSWVSEQANDLSLSLSRSLSLSFSLLLLIITFTYIHLYIYHIYTPALTPKLGHIYTYFLVQVSSPLWWDCVIQQS